MSDDDFNDELDVILSKFPSNEAYSSGNNKCFSSSNESGVQSSADKSKNHVPEQPGPRLSSSEIVLNPSSHNRLKVQRDLFGNIVSISQRNTTTVKKIQKTNLTTHHQIDLESLKTYIYPINYEIRDYQFNIIEKCFYNNVLVALPTGLGKTFIAATIILNYWRWFPDTKIVFMAPTRPLVAQQIKACFNIIGLKDESAVLLDKLKRNRLEVWDNFRIFFTTPQVVENDLCNGIVDPKLISLLIIDEAHKAKGNYAYNNVVKFLNRFNPSFRILALTATPSSTVEGIKEIVDNLNINKIEIRSENSIDIIRYFKRKRIDKIDIDYNENEIIMKCVLDLSNAAEPFIKQANERHLFELSDPMHLQPFKLLDLSKRNLANPNLSEGLKWSNHFLVKLLLFVATCFKKLKIYGFNNFKSYFLENHVKVMKSKNKMMHELFDDQNIKSLVSYLQNDNSNTSHPKIGTLIEYMKNFFKTTSYDNSKVIVFTEFRDSALEIVTSIEAVNDPSLKPHIFIGQAPDQNQKKTKKNKSIDDNSGKTSSEMAQLKGMSQKIQKELIQDFKSGKFNILVATSIGEEGLDIGEVDLIVCYDSTRSPIKNVQRLGRTGRKRDGNILMLFSDNERSKFEKAMDNYEWIQKYIMNNESELVCESTKNRILPKDIRPKIEKKFIVPEEITIDDNDEIIKIAVEYMNKNGKKKSKSKPKAKPTKKQSKVEKRFFMPDNVSTGFQNVSEMLKTQGKDTPVDIPSLPELIDVGFISEKSFEYDKSLRLDGKDKTPIDEIHTSKAPVSGIPNSEIPTHKVPINDSLINDIPINDTPTSEIHINENGIPSNKKRKVEDVPQDDCNSPPGISDQTQILEGISSDTSNQNNSTDNDTMHLLNTSAEDSISDKFHTYAANNRGLITGPTHGQLGHIPPGNEHAPDNIRKGPTVHSKTNVVNNQETESGPNGYESDEFSDDEVLRSFNKSKLKSAGIPHNDASKTIDTDVLASNVFQPNDGFLTADEKFQLYTYYYNPLPPYQEHFGPQSITPSSNNSKVSKRFFEALDTMHSITEEQSQARIRYAKLKSRHLTSESCAEHLNKYVAD